MKLFNWVGNALSEGLTPSSKRLMAFMFAFTICACEAYHTHKKQAFDTTHMGYLLIAIMLLAGVATMPQLLEAWKGGGSTTTIKQTDTKEVEITTPAKEETKPPTQ